MTKDSLPTIQERGRDPVLLTWYRFVRVLRKIVTVLDEPLQDLDVTRSQFDLLMQVAFQEGINQQTCAERMDVTKGNITQHIDRLEKGGLIQRQKQGRTNSLYLTETGKVTVANIMPLHDQRVKDILSILSEEEFGQFQAILRKFDRSLG